MLLALMACQDPAGVDAHTAPRDSALDSADTSGREPLNLVVVLDISTSWSQPDFGGARDGLSGLLAAMVDRGVPDDRVALVVFTGRHADLITPWTGTAGADSTVAPVWSGLNVASRSGEGQPFPEECQSNTHDDFGNGGCYPQMPRSYADEAGTDFTVGIQLAGERIAGSPGTGDGALVIVTDGVANGLAAANGTTRSAAGYVESRWPEYVGPAPHTTADIEAESVSLAAEIEATSGYSTYVVSIGGPSTFLDDMAAGLGTHEAVGDASGLGAALTGIVERY